MAETSPASERPAAISRAVRDTYRRVADEPEGHFAYPVGRESLRQLGYRPEWLEGIPEDVAERFVGVGNPFQIRLPREGERVLDLGCGCGLDTFVAARHVGEGGEAVGVDLTPEMVAVARGAAAAWPLQNVRFLAADAARLPFDDASFDLVLSNGVLNLVPDKDAAFRELHRVLRPDGLLAAADLVVVDTVPREVVDDVGAWST